MGGNFSAVFILETILPGAGARAFAGESTGAAMPRRSINAGSRAQRLGDLYGRTDVCLGERRGALSRIPALVRRGAGGGGLPDGTHRGTASVARRAPDQIHDAQYAGTGCANPHAAVARAVPRLDR